MYRNKSASNASVNKPFQIPIVNRPLSNGNSEKSKIQIKKDMVEPVIKKMKITPKSGTESASGFDDTISEPLKVTFRPSKILPGQTMRPLFPANVRPDIKLNTHVDIEDKYYQVLYRKFSTKKNKSWDGDGCLVVSAGKLGILQDDEGKQVTKQRVLQTTYENGEELKMGFYEIEIENEISKEKYLSGSAYLAAGTSGKATAEGMPMLKYQTPTITNHAISGALRRTVKVVKARYDPLAENAIVLTKPHNTKKKIVDVVVDPHLGKFLRPHQKEGVQFLYECVMGMRDYQGKGAILADEMGLGKTLMTITLIWTLLKQTPYAGEEPVIKRALIVCPVTLISNWKNEFKKWLGNVRIGIFTLDNNKNNLQNFVAGRCYQVMIVGYEKLRTISDELKKASIDLIVCDEGHRLKTATNKSAQAILALKTDRRIILSGTPIQNDLGEFFTMVDFLNPGILGTYATFKREFELPIVKSRQPEAMKKDIEKGTMRSEELSKLTRLFTLRRTASTLEKYLPPKTETVLFCKPLSHQVKVYRDLLESTMIKSCIGSNDAAEHLRAITMLKKVCNAPALLKDAEFGNSNLAIPATLSTGSGKMRVLEDFMKNIYEKTSEKVVIVSGYTKTLDIIEDKLKDMNLATIRLDGSTATKKRQEFVNTFNTCTQDKGFAFLLSAKSGGAGLNLIGASRLFLFDTDWNPSVDLQAMARIHRDGQKRPVYIYRLLTTGTMDEKIYQRQITKQGLADTFMDGGAAKSLERSESSDKKKLLCLSKDLKYQNSKSNSFSLTELQDLFSINTDTICNTHDLLECKCLLKATKESSIEKDTEEDSEDEGLGGWTTAKSVNEGTAPVPKRLRNKDKMSGLHKYKHLDPIGSEEFYTGDTILDEIAVDSKSLISFVFTKSSTENLED